MNLEKAVIDYLEILPKDKPMRTPDLRKALHKKHKNLKFTKGELNGVLYWLLSYDRVKRHEPSPPMDAPRWSYLKEKNILTLK